MTESTGARDIRAKAHAGADPSEAALGYINAARLGPVGRPIRRQSGVRQRKEERHTVGDPGLAVRQPDVLILDHSNRASPQLLWKTSPDNRAHSPLPSPSTKSVSSVSYNLYNLSLNLGRAAS